MRKSINNYTHQLTNVNIQKNNSGDRSRRSHNDHSVHTTRSTKHHLLPNPNPSNSAKQNFVENSSINVRPAPKSLNSYVSSWSRLSHASSHSSNSGSSKKSSSDSHVLNPSYLAVLERRRTIEHAELLVKQAEERTERKLKILQKSFDYKRQNILEEVEEAKNNRAIVNFETYGFEKLDFGSNPHEHESPQKYSRFNKSNAYQNFAPSVNS